MEQQIILVCGNWKFERNRWLFVVDVNLGSRILAVKSSTRYENFLGMVYEDYGMDKRVYDVKLSYMVPKKIKQNLPLDTPPVYVGNFRQFSMFVAQSKANMLRLCVEVKKKSEDKFPKAEENMDVHDFDGDEDDDEDEEFRFDYCDDSDGTDSGDENFATYGMVLEDEEGEEKATLPIKKRGSTIYVTEGNETDDFSKLEMSSVDLAVGQCYDTKEDLEARMKILSVVQKFDFLVYKSTPYLWVLKCWVKGCSWMVRASPIGDYPRFHIRRYVSEHTCSVTERSARCRQATHEILGVLYKDFVGGVGPTILPQQVADALNKRFQIKVFGRRFI